MWRNGGMCDHDVSGREGRRHLAKDVQERVVVRHEDLNEIAHLGQLGRRAHKILHRSGIAVPNKDVETLTTEIVGDAASDDAESDHPNVIFVSTRHGLSAAFRTLVAYSSLRSKRRLRNPES